MYIYYNKYMKRIILFSLRKLENLTSYLFLAQGFKNQTIN